MTAEGILTRWRLGSTGRWLLPAVATLAYVFMLLPVACVAWISFFRSDIIAVPPPGYTLATYGHLFVLNDFVSGLRLSVTVAVLATAISLVVGGMAALALVRARFPGRNLLATVFLLPLTVPTLVTSLALYVFLFRLGVTLGVRIVGNIPSLVMAHVMVTLPWTTRLIGVGLNTLDRSLEDAAMNLGARPFATFRHVTLPGIKPAVLAAAAFAFLASYNELEISMFLVAPGMTTLPIVLLQRIAWNFDPTVAAMATIQIGISVVVLFILTRLAGVQRIFNVRRGL